MSLAVINGQDITAVASGAVQSSTLGAPSGVATLNGSSAVVQDPASKGLANGVASLDGTTKGPSAQISGVLSSAGLTNDAALEKTANKGLASGYAALDGTTKVVQHSSWEGVANGVATLNGSSAVVQDPASKGLANGVASLDANTTLTAAQIPASVPQWVKVTKTFTDLSFAGTTNDIQVYSLPAGGIIMGVKIKHSTAFSGGSISAYTVSVGISTNFTKYASAFDVFQAVSGTTFQLTDSFGSEDHGAATSIRLQAISTGGNLSTATAGSVDVWILVSVAV